MTEESELYAPVRNLFSAMGYKVNAEVRSCDVTALKDEELIIIELKKSLSVHLLSQALQRQRTGAAVYVAVPKPKKYSPPKFRDTLYVLKKLELGLIFVTLRGEFSFAEIITDPEPFSAPRSKSAEKRLILKEINGRSVELNTGGVTGKKIATAFTERSIRIACILKELGPLTPKQVKDAGGGDCSGLMYRNVYGWFARLGGGLYAITEEGLKGLKMYPELTGYYSKLIKEKD